MPARRSFASDNNAGIHPAVVAAISRANAGHVVGYGDDPYTHAAERLFARHFGAGAAVFPVFNGTGANVLALKTLAAGSHHAVLCAQGAHVEVDECGAPEAWTGCKLISVPTEDGKLTPALVEDACHGVGDQHHVQPRVITISQSTELGTVYQPAEVKALARFARAHGMFLHMDGARISNAAAKLGLTLRQATRDLGVDVLSFGGTKNGLGFGEAVVFFDASLADEFGWRVKQAGQLNSKMRLATAPWLGLLANDVWLANARHANAMAKRLAEGIVEAPGVRLMHPVEANAVFADVDPRVQAVLRGKGWQFYTFLGATGCRLMCAWDTEPRTVDRFVTDLAQAANTAT
jgi:threonine aldolase